MDGDMGDTRIIVVSTACRNNPTLAIASVSENAVHILETRALPRNINQLREKLADAQRKAEKLKADLFVEDYSGMLSGFGYEFRLDGKHSDNRPIYAVAMERYQSLRRINALSFPDGSGATYTINDTILNIRTNDNGSTAYQMDWSQLKDESRLMLLTIYAGLCQTPYHDGYLKALFGALGFGKEEPDPKKTFMETCRGFNNRVAKGMPKTLSGTKRDGGVIL